MKRMLATGIAGAFLFVGLSGCVLHTHPRGRTTTVVYKERGRCHPSEYWDGNSCRHKGRGHAYGHGHGHHDD